MEKTKKMANIVTVIACIIIVIERLYSIFIKSKSKQMEKLTQLGADIKRVSTR